MRVLVTGAGGFLGAAVVKAAQAAGHAVLAMHRPASLPREEAPTGVTILAGDLRQPGDWQKALADIDGVIHCAAAASGDLPTQLGGTVMATENLLAALPKALKRFVHVSSFSVYDFDAPAGTLDENTPLEANPQRRDAYTATKLMQERMVRDHAAAQGYALVAIRPGAIYGPGKNWDFGRAMQLGPFDLIFAPSSPMRLTHVDNCAEALVLALAAPSAEQAGKDGVAINIVDNEQPSHWRFHSMARKAGAVSRRGLPVPYIAVLGLGLAARIASKLFFEGKARLPEMFDIPRQRVRWRSLRYANNHAHDLLGWQPRVSLSAGMAQLAQAENQSSLLP